MHKLSEIKDANKLKLFIMGMPGSGKTIFSTSLPGKTLVWDFDNKISSAYNYWKLKDPSRLENIEVTNCSQVDHRGTGFKKMNVDLLELNQDFEANGKIPYDTLVVDSATFFSRELMNWIVNEETGIKPNRLKYMNMPQLQHWGVFEPTLRGTVYALFGFNCNVIFTGHIKVSQDNLTGEILREPNIKGQSASLIPAMFNEVYVSYVKGNKYMAQTQADFKYPCRSQIPGLPKEIELSYESLIKKY